LSFYKQTTVSDYLALPKDSQRQMCPMLAESLVAAYIGLAFFAKFVSGLNNLIGSMSGLAFCDLASY